MATETIYMRTELRDGIYHLELSNDNINWQEDNITTMVDPGDNVIWRLASRSGISEISNIEVKPGSVNVFSVDPASQPDGTWEGTIRNNAERGSSESYSISYIPTGASRQTDDPIIDVRQE